ncbi:MAG TPA: cytidine deaminase [Candidatus Onthovivens sp.]|nr:cytidine deaminase [Candidatus Onthovivens sp.]
MNEKELVELAKKARENAYAPYSKFKVGAAVIANDDRVFLGANIENASYGLCMCAERNALFNAVSNGIKPKEIKALVIIADTDKPVSPCGACRQVIEELLSKDTPIILSNLHGDIKITNSVELLPYAFSESDL